MGAVHKSVLHSLQSSYTLFSPCLQRGPLNPSILGCTDPPAPISCHHPPLPTPSPSPRKQKQPSLQTPLSHGEGSGQSGWVAHHALPIQSHKRHCYSPDVPCGAAGASGDRDKKLGLLTHFKQPIPLPWHTQWVCDSTD